jgi:hypothetical protein
VAWGRTGRVNLCDGGREVKSRSRNERLHMARISLARSLHDVGLAVWCGGALMGAVGLNGAGSTLADPTQRGRAVNEGWQRWAPVNAVAIGAHLVGGALIVRENRGRIGGQQGVAIWTGTKTALTGAALASTAATGYFSKQVWAEGDVPLQAATTPTAATPAGAAKALGPLRILQWITPALTGALIASSAVMGEQQRPAEVAKGAAKRAAQTITHPQVAARALHLVS